MQESTFAWGIYASNLAKEQFIGAMTEPFQHGLALQWSAKDTIVRTQLIAHTLLRQNWDQISQYLLTSHIYSTS